MHDIQYLNYVLFRYCQSWSFADVSIFTTTDVDNPINVIAAKLDMATKLDIAAKLNIGAKLDIGANVLLLFLIVSMSLSLLVS